MAEFTQDFIDELISCEKTVVQPPKKQMAVVGDHFRNDMTLVALKHEYTFAVFMRKSCIFEENFTIGLQYVLPEGGRITILRCNGPHGEHCNDLPGGDHFMGYHIHKATEEAIASDCKPEIQAELTTEYSTYDDAFCYFLSACNVIDRHKYYPSKGQMSLID